MPAEASPSISARPSFGNNFGLPVKCPVADHAGFAPIDIEHRRKTKIHAVCDQFSTDHMANADRQLKSPLPAIDSQRSPSARIGGMAVKPLTESLHPPAFVINRNRQRRLAQIAWMALG